MTINIYQADAEKDKAQVETLFLEYLDWACAKLKTHYDIEFDSAAVVKGDMESLSKFMPPSGYLFLCEVDGKLAGLTCMKQLSESICEIKRMYVRPDFRGKGLGRALLQQMIDKAKALKYPLMRLDSSRFMTEAHGLYQAVGFKEIEPYEGSEIPEELQQHWRFFERPLT